MGSLRDKIFYQTINGALNKLRGELCAKYKEKKEKRFFSNGITYEVSEGKLLKEGVQIEISSKIPLEIFDKKGQNQKYFNDVKKFMNSRPKRPADVDMENIIRSTTIDEVKERDYIKCTYFYKENELYTEKDVDKIVQEALAGKLRIPEISGVTTLPGQAVLYLMEDHIYSGTQANITDLINSNEDVMQKFGKPSRETAKSG